MGLGGGGGGQGGHCRPNHKKITRSMCAKFVKALISLSDMIFFVQVWDERLGIRYQKSYKMYTI